MYFNSTDSHSFTTKPSNKVKKRKMTLSDFYEDGGKKTKIDPYRPEKFRKKINIRDIQIEDDV
jgi:hypothetical protein